MPDRPGISLTFDRDVIHNKDCSRMKELPDEAIDLIISGPPYWNFIDYSAFCRGENHLWQKDSPYESYLKDLVKWHKECFRVLRRGRYCIVNLTTMSRGSTTYPIPFHAVALLEKIGFSFCFEIVWHKVSGGRGRMRNFVQYPYPGGFTPNIRTEYLLVFRKTPEVRFVKYRNQSEKEQSRITLNDFFVREIANNVWHIPPPSKGAKPAHPCPFPIEIPARLIKLFSLPGETVLDPFAGIGTTARAAKALGRHFIGYEIEADFIRTAMEALKKPVQWRSQILCRYEKHDWDPIV